MNGCRSDQTIVNMTLERLAEAMGHSQVATTVRHYLVMALIRSLDVGGASKTKSVRSLWHDLDGQQRTYSNDQLRVVASLLRSFADYKSEEKIEKICKMAVAKFKKTSTEPAIVKALATKITIVR